MDINQLAREAHGNSKAHGFWRDIDLDNIPVEIGLMKMMLICTEVAEAAEVIRDKGDSNPRYHLAEELADIFIRTADLCEAYHIDIEAALIDKMERNRLRPVMHGKLA